MEQIQTEKDFKKYLLSKKRSTLVELYLQKCYDTELEKLELIKEIQELKHDIKMITNNYVSLLILNSEQRTNKDKLLSINEIKCKI